MGRVSLPLLVAFSVGLVLGPRVCSLLGPGACFLGSDKERRIDNFSAGPAQLPLAVLKKAQADFISLRIDGGDRRGVGMNIMEISHRDVGGPVQSLMQNAEHKMRDLLSIPESYAVLYVHGGAHGQFAGVVLNLLGGADSEATADYAVHGFWSRRAMLEGRKQVDSGERLRELDILDRSDPAALRIKPTSEWGVSPSARYVHLCASETIDGIEFLEDPVLPDNLKHIPLVADFTSTLLSRPVDVSKYGVIYASGGKNLGPSGFAVVIVRRDLLREDYRSARTPSILDWKVQSETKPIPSIYNTPPTFPIYMHDLVLQHLKETAGARGLDAVQERAIRRAKKIYDVVSRPNSIYRSNVHADFRSRMNVPMRILDSNRAAEDKFVADAAALGMRQLFGHPVSGGLRVTLYNGITDASVTRVAKFMLDWEEKFRGSTAKADL